MCTINAISEPASHQNKVVFDNQEKKHFIKSITFLFGKFHFPFLNGMGIHK